MLQLISRKNRDFVAIYDFTDQALALVTMQNEGDSGEANNWELTPVGKNYHYEFDYKDGELWNRRVPPLRK